METLRYLPWQKWAAGWRLVLGLAALAPLLLHLGEMEGYMVLIGLVAGLVGVLYILRTAVQPLLRSGLEVALEPEGIRVGGRFYPRSAFPILHRASGWLAEWAWAGLDSLARYLPLAPDPPFYLDFGGTRLPLYLDLPGWDRLLRHLGLEWKEAPILREFLVTVRGVGWLNGLLYPPEEVQGAWAEARSRYRQACFRIWLGLGAMLLGGVGESLVEARWEEGTPLLWAAMAVVLAGFMVSLYGLKSTFGGGGWADRYTPFNPKA